MDTQWHLFTDFTCLKSKNQSRQTDQVMWVDSLFLEYFAKFSQHIWQLKTFCPYKQKIALGRDEVDFRTLFTEIFSALLQYFGTPLSKWKSEVRGQMRWHTIKPGTPEHGTPSEQRNTPEHQRNTQEQQRNKNVTLAKQPGTTKPYKTKKYCRVF